MAYQTTRYQYETSPRKLKPEYEPKKNPIQKKKSSALKPKKSDKKIKQQEKKDRKKHLKMVSYILLGFSILFAISYRNSLITENFNKTENLKNQLSMLQKENDQIEINIQNSLNLAKIEKSASELLGMKKIDESQKVYVNLPKKDYVEPASEQVKVTEEKNWFQQVLDTIMSWMD